MTQDFVDQSSYKAIEGIYKTILNIMIAGNTFGLAFASFLGPVMTAICFVSFVAAALFRFKFDVKYRYYIAVSFHANVILATISGVALVGWDAGVWILLLGIIFANYFLAFNSKILTYGISLVELGILIVLYFLYKDSPLAVPHWVAMTLNIVNTVFIFYAILRLAIFADIITSSGYQQERDEKEQLERLSKYDFLTGLLNRRTIEKMLKYELSTLREKNAKSNLVVMLGDIDNFKMINDTFGHEWGDTILKEVANTLLTIFRKDDYVCRWGGEEFLVVLPNTKIDFIHKITSRLTKSINSVKLPDKSAVSMTFGMLVCINGATTDFEYIISRVDELLYQGKRAGKDRIEMEILSDAKTE